jgi:hypothetical protein
MQFLFSNTIHFCDENEIDTESKNKKVTVYLLTTAVQFKNTEDNHIA